MSYKQKSLKLGSQCLQKSLHETWTSVTVNGWGLGCNVCVMIGLPKACTRNAVWCQFIASLSTAHDGRVTHRPVLKTAAMLAWRDDARYYCG